MYKHYIQLAFGILLSTLCLMCPVYADWLDMHTNSFVQGFLIFTGATWAVYATYLCVEDWKFSWIPFGASLAIVFRLSVYTYGYEQYLEPSFILRAWGTLLAVAVAGAGGLLIMTNALTLILQRLSIQRELRQIRKHLRKNGLLQ